jgi:hypothetical protein
MKLTLVHPLDDPQHVAEIVRVARDVDTQTDTGPNLVPWVAEPPSTHPGALVAALSPGHRE